MKMASSGKRVLIYRLGSLGDTVVALPALHLVARAFPQAERRMLTNFPVNVKAPAAAVVLGENGLVDGYFRYTAGTRSPRALLALWWTLIRWRPQVLVYLGAARGVESAQRDSTFFKICGIRKQIGVPLTEAMQRNLPQGGDPANLEPEAERLCRNIAELGDAKIGTQAAWDLGLTDAEHEAAKLALQPAGAAPILAVSVGTKVQSKDWGAENWRGLLARLGSLYPGYALALMGAPEESAASEAAAEGWRETAGAGAAGLGAAGSGYAGLGTAGSRYAGLGAIVINLCGKLTPRESAAAFARAKVFLGHDSGPMHLAATVGTPCVAIFAARNIPRVWYPYGAQHRVVYHAVNCMGCGLETCIVEAKKCLTSITVDEVADQVRTLLR